MSSEEYSVTWIDHHRKVVTVFGRFLDQDTFVDCTIAAEGACLKAHRLMLSACSPYFELLFKQEMKGEKVVVLEDIKFETLKSLITFMYQGQVTVPKDRLRDFVRAAESLQIEGLPSDLVHNSLREPTEMPVVCRKERVASHLSDKHMRCSAIGNESSDMQCENFNASSIGRKQSRDERSSMVIQTELLEENVFLRPQSVSESYSNREATVFLAEKESSVEPKVEVDVEDTSIWESDDENTSTLTGAFCTTAGEEIQKELTPVIGTVSSNCSSTSSPNILEKELKSCIPMFSSVTATIPSLANTASISPVLTNIVSDGSCGTKEDSSSYVQAELQEQRTCVEDKPVVKTEVVCSHSESIVEPMHAVWLEDMQSWEGEHVKMETDTAAISNQETSNQNRASASNNNQHAVWPNIMLEEQEMMVTAEKTLETDTDVEQNDTKEEKDVDSDPLSERISKRLEKKSHKCRRCPDVFHTASDLRVHIKKLHRKLCSYRCEMCMAAFTYRSHLMRHMRTHTGERPFECNVCKMSFSARSNLVSHMRTHTGDRPYQCSDCAISFSDKSSLKRHMRRHTGERPYQCNVCAMPFSDKSNLNVHLRKHTGECPFQCNLCNMSFRVKSSLTSHMRAHTGERPFQCSECTVSFSDKSCLKRHMRTHTGERPYQCNVCAMSFSEKGNLNLHQRKHTGERPYECDVCQMAFNRLDNLTVHKRQHTGERPFQCNLCNKSFIVRSSLTSHMRTHTGERPFQCSVCTMSYSDKRSLIVHQQKHTIEHSYLCEVCKIPFSQMDSLTVHKMTAH